MQKVFGCSLVSGGYVRNGLGYIFKVAYTVNKNVLLASSLLNSRGFLCQVGNRFESVYLGIINVNKRSLFLT